MNAFLVFSGTAPMVILTSHEGIEDPSLLERLRRKGISKFIAYPVPEEIARRSYGIHYDIVCGHLHESDDLRVLDFDGRRAMELFPFDVLGKPVYHEDAQHAYH